MQEECDQRGTKNEKTTRLKHHDGYSINYNKSNNISAIEGLPQYRQLSPEVEATPIEGLPEDEDQFFCCDDVGALAK